eukprot:gene2359-433_t
MAAIREFHSKHAAAKNFEIVLVAGDRTQGDYTPLAPPA